jgi:hypothetical protein
MASVPDTDNFSLQDVVNVIGGPGSLVACFTYAVDSYFDPAYKGSKTSLLNFRNYQEPYIAVNNTYGVFHFNKGILYGANNTTVSYAKGTISSVTWATGTHFYYTRVGDVFTIICNGDNYSGTIWTDTLTFHLSVGGLTAVFTATQFTSPN